MVVPTVPTVTAPTVASVPVQNLTAGIAATLDLAPYIVAGTTPLGSLTVTEDSVYVSVSGLVLTLQFPAPFSGSFDFHVTDGMNVVDGTVPVVVRAAGPAASHPCGATRGMNDVGDVRCELQAGHIGPHKVTIAQVRRDGAGEVRGWYDDSPRV